MIFYTVKRGKYIREFNNWFDENAITYENDVV